MVTWYWSADTLLWQVSIDHNIDVQYQRSTPFLRSVVVVRTRPRTIPLATISMRKLIHWFPFLSYMSIGLRLAALGAAGAPLIYISKQIEEAGTTEFFLRNKRRKFVKTLLKNMRYNSSFQSKSKLLPHARMGSSYLNRVISGQQESLSDTANCFYLLIDRCTAMLVCLNNISMRWSSFQFKFEKTFLLIRSFWKWYRVVNFNLQKISC